MLELYPVPIALVLVAALIAAVTDVWKFKVYNLLTFPLLASGLLYHAIQGGTPGLAGSIIGALAGFALMIVLYTMGGMGAGDVKFVTALGAWLGLPLTLYVLIAGCIAAGVYAVDPPGDRLLDAGDHGEPPAPLAPAGLPGPAPGVRGPGGGRGEANRPPPPSHPLLGHDRAGAGRDHRLAADPVPELFAASAVPHHRLPAAAVAGTDHSQSR